MKEDWCNTGTQDVRESYTLMRNALYHAGRPIVFSLCEWGTNKPWLWGGDVGDLWRTTGDISDSWHGFYADGGKVWGGSVLANLKMEHGLEKYAGPGHWNDPDMLEIGNGGLSLTEERAHFSLWCMVAAPLMAGNDLRSMKAETRAILTEKELISVDQDKLGRQGYQLMEDENWLVYVKPLAGEDSAICFLNKSGAAKDLAFDWSAHHFSGGHSLRDLWRHRAAATTVGVLKARIDSHDVLVLRLRRNDL